MDRFARRVNRLAAGSFYGAAAYWAVNLALVAAEARWHVLYRLTLWDVSQIKALSAILERLIHS
jgi:hypothetical protein